MRPDTFRDWTENHNSLLGCFNYYLGVLEVGLSLAFTAAMVIFLSGIIGEYHWSLLLIVEDISLFYWATDIPVLDFW